MPQESNEKKESTVEKSAGKSGAGTEKKQEQVRVCKVCGASVRSGEARENYFICPHCGGYFRVHAYQRINMIVDEGTFEEWNKEMPFSDPLDFPGYEEKVEEVRDKTHLNEGVVTGCGQIGGYEVVIGVCDSRYLSGSMGHNMGEKITYAVERATRLKLPVLLYAASGGARMQEGLSSLMQMAKTSAALKRHSDAGQLYISFLTNPTTGGVTASFAMLGDIILAEPGALIGFAGPRVIEQTIQQKLPEGFQRAEFQLEHGFVDQVVPRQEQKKVLTELLKLHREGCDWQSWNTDPESYVLPEVEERAVEAGAEEPEHTRSVSSIIRRTLLSGSARRRGRARIAEGESDAWNIVRESRKSGRLTSIDYIDALFEDFEEMHGDRAYGDDPAIIGGIASFCGMPVTVIGQERGRNANESISRNFGMPSPEGYRKALRLMREAEKFGRPIVCFVDTPGAYPGKEAEERGQGEAIARNLYEMSDLAVPVLTLIIGQGGSGGALALAVSNEVWMMEKSTYSIISPEGFASILWKDSEKANEAAKHMKMTAGELYELGFVDRIIQEEVPANQENLERIRDDIAGHMEEFFEESAQMTAEELEIQRYERFRKF